MDYDRTAIIRTDEIPLPDGTNAVEYWVHQGGDGTEVVVITTDGSGAAVSGWSSDQPHLQIDPYDPAASDFIKVVVDSYYPADED